MTAIFDGIAKQLPQSCKEYLLKKINLEDFLKIRSVSLSENPYKDTCWPLKERSDEEARTAFAEILGSSDRIDIGIYFAAFPEEVVGRLNFFNFNPRNRSCELGYFLMPDYRRSGIMHSALAQLIPLFFDLGMNKIYAQTGSFNLPSVRLLRRLGFSQDALLREHHELNGVLHDTYVFSILKSDGVKNNTVN